MDIHTPSIPQNFGRINNGRMRKIRVRNKERIAEDFPSFNAVKKPDANRWAIGFAKGNAIPKVIRDKWATVFSVI